MINLLPLVFLWFPKEEDFSTDLPDFEFESDSGSNSILLDPGTRNLLWTETFGVDLTNLPKVIAADVESPKEFMTYEEAKQYCQTVGNNSGYQLPGLYSKILQFFMYIFRNQPETLVHSSLSTDISTV